MLKGTATLVELSAAPGRARGTRIFVVVLSCLVLVLFWFCLALRFAGFCFVSSRRSFVETLLLLYLRYRYFGDALQKYE